MSKACIFFSSGHGCSRGNNCRYSHEGPGITLRPQPCRLFFSPAGCRFGDRCRFSHVNEKEFETLVPLKKQTNVQETQKQEQGEQGKAGEDNTEKSVATMTIAELEVELVSLKARYASFGPAFVSCGMYPIELKMNKVQVRLEELRERLITRYQTTAHAGKTH